MRIAIPDYFKAYNNFVIVRRAGAVVINFSTFRRLGEKGWKSVTIVFACAHCEALIAAACPPYH